MRVTLSVCLMLFALGVSSQSKATPASEAQTVRELFKAMDLEHMTEASIEANAVSLAQQTDQPDKAKPAMEKFLRDTVGFKVLENDMIKIYERHFTEAELREILKFYRTPIGAKLIRSQMPLLKEGAALGQSRLAARQKDLQKLVQAYKKK